jgi:hypothetical protein
MYKAAGFKNVESDETQYLISDRINKMFDFFFLKKGLTWQTKTKTVS